MNELVEEEKTLIETIAIDFINMLEKILLSI